MSQLVSALGRPVAKILLRSWLGDVASQVGDNLIRVAESKLRDRSKALTLSRSIETISESIVQDLSKVLERDVEEEDLLAAAEELGETLRLWRDPKLLVDNKLDENLLINTLLSSRPIEKIYSKGDPAAYLYTRLLQELVPRLRMFAPDVPGYQIERDAQLLKQVDDLANSTDIIISRLHEIDKLQSLTDARIKQIIEREDVKIDRYLQDYLNSVRTELNWVDLVGLSLDDLSSRIELDAAYLSLRARRQAKSEARRMDIATLFTLLPGMKNRVIVEGPAGSGKTTLLRWAAITAAKFLLTPEHLRDDPLQIASDIDSWIPLIAPEERRAEIDFGPSLAEMRKRLQEKYQSLKSALAKDCWQGRIPFFVALRRTGANLNLEGLLSHASTMGRPMPGWLDEAAKQGLILIDGLDEVASGSRRQEVVRQIENWSRRFPDAQIVVTTRPGACDPASLNDFARVELEELDDDQKLKFIEHWHQALGKQLGWGEDDEILKKLVLSVKLELERQRSINDLASNPLLCASLCALHWDRRKGAARQAYIEKNLLIFREDSSVLPNTLWRLCDDMAVMLLERRERESFDLDLADFSEAYRLSYEKKRSILSKIAFGMSEGEIGSTISRSDAIRRVESSLHEMREVPNATPEDILEALLERSGILRPSGDDDVEFIHNTIKSFLASQRYLAIGEPTVLSRRIIESNASEIASGLDEIAIFCSSNPTGKRFAEEMICLLHRKAEECWGCGDRTRARVLRILAVRCETAAGTDLSPESRARTAELIPRLFPPQTMAEARQLSILGYEAIPHLLPKQGLSDSSDAACVRCLRLIGTEDSIVGISKYKNSSRHEVLEELVRIFHPFELSHVVAAVSGFSEWLKIPDSVKSLIDNLEELDASQIAYSINLQGTKLIKLAGIEKFGTINHLDISNTPIRKLDGLGELTSLVNFYAINTPIEDIDPCTDLKNLKRVELKNSNIREIGPLSNSRQIHHLDLSGTKVENIASLRRMAALEELNLAGTLVKDLEPLSCLPHLKWVELSGIPATRETVVSFSRSRRKAGLPIVQIHGF